MSGAAVVAPAGANGFDVNVPVDGVSARAFRAAGYVFAIRYIRRDPRSHNDLSVQEIETLHGAGLAVGIVQHFGPKEGWTPSDDLGRQYGRNAAAAAIELGTPPGTNVWLDLESVDPAVDVETIIRYCNRWHDVVAAAEFDPGIYVGYGARLSPDQLYRRLKFARYWGSYNLNRDEEPSVRGLCMKQHEGTAPAGTHLMIDLDTVSGDRLGGFPTLWAPDEWQNRI